MIWDKQNDPMEKGEPLADELFRLNRYNRATADKIGWLAWRVQIDDPVNYAGRVRFLKCRAMNNQTLDLTPEMNYLWSYDKCEYVSTVIQLMIGQWFPSSIQKKRF